MTDKELLAKAAHELLLLKRAFELACAERATISGTEEGFQQLFIRLAQAPERSSTLKEYRDRAQHDFSR